MLIAVTLSSFLFEEKLIWIAAISVLIFADSMAAIVGKTIGKIQLLGNKTLEGSVSFFFTAIFIGVMIFPYSQILNILMASLLTTVAELVSCKIRINDNISIPLVFGLTMMFF